MTNGWGKCNSFLLEHKKFLWGCQLLSGVGVCVDVGVGVGVGVGGPISRAGASHLQDEGWEEKVQQLVSAQK